MRGLFPRGVLIIAAVSFGLWMLVAHRYGFHRDELYFIEGGHHPAWAQPDNPILVPLLAAGWHGLVGGNLTLFRVLPALAGVATILLASLTAREIGASRRAQVVTALMVASSSFPLAVAHLFSISTFDLALTTCVLLLLIRAIGRPASLRAWLWVGLAAGIALEVKVLLALVLVSCLLGVLAVGPRGVLRRPGPWLAAAIALVGAAPNLIWQARHSWPMLEVARSIAGGGSTSSADRVMIIPLLLLLISPLLCWILILGFVATFRSEPLRAYRWIAVGIPDLARGHDHHRRKALLPGRILSGRPGPRLRFRWSPGWNDPGGEHRRGGRLRHLPAADARLRPAPGAGRFDPCFRSRSPSTRTWRRRWGGTRTSTQ